MLSSPHPQRGGILLLECHQGPLHLHAAKQPSSLRDGSWVLGKEMLLTSVTLHRTPASGPRENVSYLPFQDGFYFVACRSFIGIHFEILYSFF